MIHLKAAFYARALLLFAAMIVLSAFAQTPTVAQLDMRNETQVNPKNLESQRAFETNGFPFAPPVLVATFRPSQSLYPLEKPKLSNRQFTPQKSVPSNKTIKAQAQPQKVKRKTKTPPNPIRSSLIVRSTAYNSIPNQTDSSPWITSTGVRTRYGIIALSRDLLKRIPYGSRVRLEDNGSWGSGRGYGKYNAMLKDTVFVVEDTMHPRKNGTVDVWLPARDRAMQWGVRRLNMEIIRVGR